MKNWLSQYDATISIPHCIMPRFLLFKIYLRHQYFSWKLKRVLTPFNLCLAS